VPKIITQLNLRSNRNKFIAQGFFLTAALAVADTSTVLPLIIDYFNGSEVLIGILSSLLKGGAIIMQLWTAFQAQDKSNVLGSLRKVFVYRFLSWFLIGFSILLFYSLNDSIVLIFVSIFLFLFSFSAGVGVIYFQELIAKAFTKKYRGKAIAYKQIASGLAGIISGGISGFILELFSAPVSFAYLFFFSSFVMLFGILFFWNFKEIEKKDTNQKEKNFGLFLKGAGAAFISDKSLQFQTLTRFLSYSLFFVFPFFILHAKNQIGIEGKEIGLIISLQMIGAVGGNLLWAFLASKNLNRCVIVISFFLSIIAVLLVFRAETIEIYYVIYFLAGASIDGFRLAYSNLILIIAPENKRPMYVAVQNNLSSFGLFFAIPGGIFLKLTNFNTVSIITIFLLIIGLWFSFFLKKQ
jgi:MFS family permease